MPVCVSVHECECAYTCVSTRVWTSMYLCGVSHLKLCLFSRWWWWGGSVCVSLCVCVCIRQSLPLQGLQTLSLSLSSPPSFTLPSVRATDGRGGRNKAIGRETVLGSSDLIALSFLPASCSVFTVAGLFSIPRGYVCVSLSLLLSLSVSVSLFHSLNSELQEHRDCVQFDQCPLSLPVSSVSLSLWQAQFVFTKYANDCVCVHLLWPGSGFPPPSVSPL